ncbi:MAG: hypothetical protein GY816_23020 [Cytophagales bacterium]|nr:hypothetical protein [Cytophagales bacterium]
MEFDEMKKIWDKQNNQTMYAINEDALYRRIKAKGNRAEKTANTNEFGLMAIAVITASVLLFLKTPNYYNIIAAVGMLVMGVYVFIGRVRRLQKDRQFEHSMLGDLDRAISNMENEVFRAKTFIWWMIVPAAFPIVVRIAQNDASWEEIGIIATASLLGYLVTRWSLKKCQIPRKHELEVLRKKLIAE